MSDLTLVIGAGADELVAAHLLARAGERVLVLAERDGGGPTEGWIPPRVVRELALAQRGLRVEWPDPWAAAPLPGDGRLELWRDLARSADSIRRVSPRDAARWPEFCARMASLARVLEALYAAPPPDPLSHELRDLGRLAGLALRARRLGRQGIDDLLRLAPMPVADLLDDWFESEALKGVLGAAAVTHLRHGPRAAGTAFALLHRHVGCPPGVFRPPRSNLAELLAARPGVEVRRDAATRIDVREGRVAGVTLAGGEAIAARRVVSGAGPKRTLLEWVEPGWLDPGLARAVRNVRSRGAVARVTLMLDRAPDFTAFVVAPSLDHLERAADDAKHGRVSRHPWIEARAEGPRITVHLQYAPYALAEGDWHGIRRAALGELAEAVLVEHVPALQGAVTGKAVQSPLDLESACGWPEGQAHHAEVALDQLAWMRPTPALARYRTPIAGLYLCGPAMHPGAGTAGAAGANAAREILRDAAGRRG